MDHRCLNFFARGALFLRPIPYQRDFRCWIAGSQLSCWAMLAMVPVALFGSGFVVGRYF